MPNAIAGPVPTRMGAIGFESQAASPSAAGSTMAARATRYEVLGLRIIRPPFEQGRPAKRRGSVSLLTRAPVTPFRACARDAYALVVSDDSPTDRPRLRASRSRAACRAGAARRPSRREFLGQRRHWTYVAARLLLDLPEFPRNRGVRVRRNRWVGGKRRARRRGSGRALQARRECA